MVKNSNLAIAEYAAKSEGPELRRVYTERARAMIPVLRAREEATATIRKIPDETIAEMKAAGFFRLARPARFGGIDADFDVCMRVMYELAQGCGSTSWVYGVVILHDWFMKLYPEEIAQEVWGADQDVLISSGLQPRPVTAVPGGYRLNGDWPFSSGCDHAGWFQVGGIPKGEAPRLMMVPRAAIEIVDDWRTLGLRGTGSKTLRLHDVFVPEEFTILHERLRRIDGLGARVRRGSAWDDTPVYNGSDAFASTLIGIGARARNLVASTLRTKTSRGRQLGEVALHQLRVGEASSAIDVARFAVVEGSRMLAERVRAGEEITQAEVSQRWRDVAVQIRRLREAVDLLSLSHTSWIYDTDPFQRLHRDVFTGATHFSGRWEDFVQPVGKLVIDAAPAE